LISRNPPGSCWVLPRIPETQKWHQRDDCVFNSLLGWSDSSLCANHRSRLFGGTRFCAPRTRGSASLRLQPLLTLMKLLLFGRAGERRGRGLTTCDHLCHFVEVTGADLVLMFRRAISLGFGGELDRKCV